MQQPLQKPGTEGAPSTRRDVALIALLGAFLLLPSFFTRDLWNPDEPRYMEVAREMLALNCYVVPRLNGEIYAEKPPLFFWLAAGVYRLTGSFTSGRLVDFAATLGTLLLIYFFARRLLPAPGGLLAAAMTATIILYLAITKAGVLDPLLTFLTTGAIAAAYVALRGASRRARLGWLVFYGACGLAVLTKGPVGFFAPGVFVLVYALLQRKEVAAGGWMHLAGAVLMLGIVGAWLVPAMIQGGAEYTNIILYKQNVGRAVESYSHAHGFHYYLVQLPYYLFPWAFFFGLGLVQALLDWRRKGDGDAAFMSFWFLGIVLFFSLISGKRERYILPAMPGVALICARYFVLGRRDGYPWPRLHKWFSVATFGIAGLLAIAFGALPVWAPVLVKNLYPLDQDTQRVVAEAVTPAATAVALAVGAGLLGLAAVGVVWGLRRPRAFRAVWLLVVAVGGVSLFLDLLVFPRLNQVKSSREFGAQCLPYLQRADRRFLFQKDFSGVVNLYTGIVDIPVIKGELSLTKEQQDELAAMGLTQDERERLEAKMKGQTRARLAVERLAGALGGPGRVVVIGDERHIGKALSGLPPATWLLVRERVGHRGMMLISNDRWGQNVPSVHDALRLIEE